MALLALHVTDTPAICLSLATVASAGRHVRFLSGIYGLNLGDVRVGFLTDKSDR